MRSITAVRFSTQNACAGGGSGSPFRASAKAARKTARRRIPDDPSLGRSSRCHYPTAAYRPRGRNADELGSASSVLIAELGDPLFEEQLVGRIGRDREGSLRACESFFVETGPAQHPRPIDLSPTRRRRPSKIDKRRDTSRRRSPLGRSRGRGVLGPRSSPVARTRRANGSGRLRAGTLGSGRHRVAAPNTLQRRSARSDRA